MKAKLPSYEPNPALAWIYQRFFEHIEVDAAWAERVREAEVRGTVVYVLRNLSFVDFLALDYLTKKLGLPQVRFANDLGLWVLEPMGRGWFSALRPRSENEDVDRLRQAVDGGFSAALFLKRPKTLLEPQPVARRRNWFSKPLPLPSRGKAEGDAYLRELLDAQRASARPILLVPQVFVWTRSADAQQQNVVDALFGPREWPGKLRTVAQFLANFRSVTLRVGEPVDIRAFLENEATTEGDATPPNDDVLVRRLTYTLLRRLERERRGVLGPSTKPADRLREQVVRSPRLQKVIRDMAGEGEAQRRVLGFRALDMLREMEAQIDPNALRALDAAYDQTVARMYSAFEIDEEGLARVREAAKDGTLVLLPSHKSHIDYILLTRLFLRSNLPVPLVAAGDNLSFFPLGPILRRAGAFFIRRTFKGDRLYGAVVDAYMRRLLKDGWPLEFFLEGGRSRTGKLLPPKLGLLSIVVDAALGAREGAHRKVHFVPISIGYERVVEERAYVREVSGGEKEKEDIGGLLRAAESALGRYGKLNVQFGELLTLDGILDEISRDPPKSDAPISSDRPRTESRSGSRTSTSTLTPAKRRALVTRLAYRTMNEINRVTAVTPSAVVATALLTHQKRGIGYTDLVIACERIARVLAGSGARFTPSLVHPEHHESSASDRSPPTVRRAALREACELFLRAKHIQVRHVGEPITLRARGRHGHDRGPETDKDAFYVVPDLARLSLDISKNLIVHFFLSRAMIATPLVTPTEALATDENAPPSSEGARRRGIERALLAERAQALSRLFKFEFQFRADAPFDAIFAETLQEMHDDGEITFDDAEHVHVSVDAEGRERVLLYARVVRNFVEGYRVAARALSQLLKGPLSPKELTKRAIATGERMFLAGEIGLREAVSRPVVDNAFLAFVDQGYLGRQDGKFVLPSSYASAEAVATIEARIASYL